MRIGLDIDDTICNTNSVLMKYAFKHNEEHGNKKLIKKDTNDFSEVFGWNPEEVNLFFRTYYLDALKEIEPKENVKEVLGKLREDGHQIIFITIRNDRECGGENEAYRITEEWLRKYEIPYDELHVDIHNKKEFCEEHNIDVFMDDSVKTVSLVKTLGIKTFIAINSFNMNFKDDKITNIYSMNEFYEKIKKIEGEEKVMDYRYETKDEARDFHRQRKAFVIINNKLDFLPDGSKMSHYEYCQTKGLSKEEFNKITRGYYLNGRGLVIYKDNFVYDDELINETLLFIDEIATKISQTEFEIYFGQLPEKNFELDYHYGRYKDGKIIKIEEQ